MEIFGEWSCFGGITKVYQPTGYRGLLCIEDVQQDCEIDFDKSELPKLRDAIDKAIAYFKEQEK